MIQGQLAANKPHLKRKEGLNTYKSHKQGRAPPQIPCAGLSHMLHLICLLLIRWQGKAFAAVRLANVSRASKPRKVLDTMIPGGM
eukprot:610178-Pelagomonas_calceolata.AAC.1